MAKKTVPTTPSTPPAHLDIATGGDDLLDRGEAAKFLRVSKSLLASDAVKKHLNFPVIHVGRRAIYSKAALTRWLQDRMQNAPTARTQV